MNINLDIDAIKNYLAVAVGTYNKIIITGLVFCVLCFVFFVFFVQMTCRASVIIYDVIKSSGNIIIIQAS
jgi:hypothetical protein